LNSGSAKNSKDDVIARPPEMSASGKSTLIGGTQYDADQPLNASRDQRRSFHNYLNSNNSSGKNGPTSKEITHTVSIMKPEEGHNYKKMRLLREEIALRKEIGQNPVEQCNQLIALLESERATLDTQSNEQTGNVNISSLDAATPITRLVPR
jgi:hypothetical protein